MYTTIRNILKKTVYLIGLLIFVGLSPPLIIIFTIMGIVENPTYDGFREYIDDWIFRSIRNLWNGIWK